MNISPTVLSYNEWDPLEEVIVGVMFGAAVPEWHVTLEATVPKSNKTYFQNNAGDSFLQTYIEQAEIELNILAKTLENEGVIVKRPSLIDHRMQFATPNWQSAGGLYSAMPRDILMVIGDTIIEAPMAWRSRYFEFGAYRPLLKEYFLKEQNG